MSESLLRGLRILELLAAQPLGVTEIARRLDLDKAGVSRTLSALNTEGWVRRTGTRYVLGARALDLAPDSGDLVAHATRLTRALHEETGLACVALRLAGDAAQPLALHGEDESFLEADGPFAHLASTAGGLALLSQLPDADVVGLLASMPARRGSRSPSRDQVWDLLRRARTYGLVHEQEWTIAGLGCLAVPWAVPGAPTPLALAVVGPVASLEDPALARMLTAAAGSDPRLPTRPTQETYSS